MRQVPTTVVPLSAASGGVLAGAKADPPATVDVTPNTGEDPALNPTGPPSAAPRPHRPAVTQDGRVKVLVAEDERLLRQLLTTTLTEWGYEVSTASDGGKALATLLSADAPRLALLDWEMPGLSGVDVCRLLRGRKDAPYVYVVLCTGRDGHRYLIDGLSAGADDYIKKPFDMQELEVRLRAGRRVVLLQDQLLEAQAELERRALRDSLTGAKNRGAIVDTLVRELSRNRRTRRPLSIVLLDVDHFKVVNDSHGHPAGDAVLRELVRRAHREVRTHDEIGRWGGEEFLVILPECPTEEAMRVAERLRTAIANEPVNAIPGGLPVTASFGVAGTDQGYTELNTMISAADAALYAAKTSGRNRVSKAFDAAGEPVIRVGS